MQSNRLVTIAESLEERDTRSKWDWITLATAMIIRAALASAGAYFYAKDSIKKANFTDAISLIQNDDQGTWCTRYANGQIVNANDGSKHCAIHMPNYVATE